LTDASQALYSSYKGDICRFLSEKGVSGLKKSWVMPKSELWKGTVNTGYPFVGGSVTVEDVGGDRLYTWTTKSTANTTADVAGGTLNYLSFTIIGSNESATFPASGYRSYDGGALVDVGVNGVYWSSSVGVASGAYYLYFFSNEVGPAYGNGNRAWGLSVRCVQN
jgi:hypothetical protein